MESIYADLTMIIRIRRQDAILSASVVTSTLVSPSWRRASSVEELELRNRARASREPR